MDSFFAIWVLGVFVTFVIQDWSFNNSLIWPYVLMLRAKNGSD